MQNIGLVLITVLIPFAIAILVDILQKRNNQSIDYANLDLHVILDHVFKIKWLIFYVGLIFAPPLFWESSMVIVRILLFIIWLIGVYCLIMIIIDIYHWTKGDVNKFRFSYLIKLKNYKDIPIIWRSVWEVKTIGDYHEIRFFDIYSLHIDTLLDNDKDLPIIYELLNDFSLFLNNRSIRFLVRPNKTLTKLLNWHLLSWEKDDQMIANNKDSSMWPDYHALVTTLNNILGIIQEKVLKGNEAYFYFTALREHVKPCKNKVYLNHFFENIYSVLFNIITNIASRNDMWKYHFPSEWKITKNNLVDDDNLVAKITYKEFAEWASYRMIAQVDDYDTALSEVARELFPEVDPLDWAAILIFVWSPRDPQNVIESIIKRRWNFGDISRVYPFHSDAELISSIERERINTLELSFFLFGKVFSLDKLNQYVERLEMLIYAEESDQEYNRLRLLRIFKIMIEYLGRKKKNTG